MRYKIKAHPTVYKGVLFRSRLEATWAAFFDIFSKECEFKATRDSLIRSRDSTLLKWKYEPFDLEKWTPDFELIIPCYHYACPSFHTILIEIKPYRSIEQFSKHPCHEYSWGQSDLCDGVGTFGYHFDVQTFGISHGEGGGYHSLLDFIWAIKGQEVESCMCEMSPKDKELLAGLWFTAQNITRYNPDA